jgi:hypothetical protein
MKYINPVALAADCGIHSQTIRIIKGSGGAPKAETMIKLSDFFDDQLYEINGLAERRDHPLIKRADVVEVGESYEQ